MSSYSSTSPTFDGRTYQSIIIALVASGLTLIGLASIIYRRRRRRAFELNVRSALARRRNPDGSRAFEVEFEPSGLGEDPWGGGRRGGEGGGKKCKRFGREPAFWDALVGGGERAGEKDGGAGQEGRKSGEVEDNEGSEEKEKGKVEENHVSTPGVGRTGGWDPIALSYLTHAPDARAMNPPPGTRPPQPTEVELTILIAMPTESSDTHQSTSNQPSTSRPSTASSSSTIDLKSQTVPQLEIDDLPHFQFPPPPSHHRPLDNQATRRRSEDEEEQERQIPVVEMGTTTLPLSKVHGRRDDDLLKRIRKDAITAGLTSDDSTGPTRRGGCRGGSGGVRIERVDGFRS